MSRLLFGLQQRGIYSFPRYIRVVSASRTPSRFHHLSPHETPKSGFSLAISCQSTVFKIRTQSFRLVSTFLALSRSGISHSFRSNIQPLPRKVQGAIHVQLVLLFLKNALKSSNSFAMRISSRPREYSPHEEALQKTCHAALYFWRWDMAHSLYLGLLPSLKSNS